MPRRIASYVRRHHIGALALFFALAGGTAYATHPGGANTISSGDIIDGAVRTQDIRDEAVTAPKLGPSSVGSGKVINDALTGDDIDEASLSGVVACPAETNLAGDVCFTSQRSGELLAAFRDCADEGLRLPEAGEALVVEGELGGADELWTSEVLGATDVLGTTEDAEGDPDLELVPFDDQRAYRCVTGPRA